MTTTLSSVAAPSGSASKYDDFRLIVFEPDYYTNMAACAAAEGAHVQMTIGHIHTVPQAVQPDGDPASQVLRSIDRRSSSLPGMAPGQQSVVKQIHNATLAR